MRILKALIPALMISMIMLGSAEGQDFAYTVSNGAITITQYRGLGGAVTVPASINNLPVVEIGDYAFIESKVTRVTMPDSVRRIGSLAFGWCTLLRSIAIPNGVTNIGDSAFYSCSGLTSITIPQSVTSMGQPFAECIRLSAINVDGLNTAYSSLDGVLYDKNQTTALICPPGKRGQYIIPDGVIHIGSSAFWNCTNLTGVTLPDSLTTIGDQAFWLCTSLARIDIPDSVNNVGGSAFDTCTSLTNAKISSALSSIPHAMFSRCYSLTSITVPQSVTNIEDWAFWACASLSYITLPTNVTGIGYSAFGGCTGLTNVSFSTGLINIGPWAFSRCSSLTRVFLPETLDEIGEHAFASCNSLRAIEVDAHNSAYASVDGVLFEKDQTRIIQFPIGRGGSYTIPNGVSTLANASFENCTNLTNITFASGLINVGNYAFYGCAGLTSVAMPDSVTDIGYLAFAGCAGLTNLTLGSGLMSLGDSGFAGCSNLAEVTIPNSLTNIGINAFSGCTKLASIDVGVLNPAYRSIEGVLFDKQLLKLLQYPLGRRGSYSIPGTVTTIGVSAFAGCTGLTNVTMSGSVTNIQEYAFNSCLGLTEVVISKNVTFIGNFAFAQCANLRGIYFEGDAPGIGALVFDGYTNATVYYMPGATGWPSTFAGLPTALWRMPEGWVVTVAPEKEWSSVACSADGSKILASEGGGSLWFSTNSGITWRSNDAPKYNWASVAVSADGSKLFAAGSAGLYASTNAGFTWMWANPGSNINWSGIACSADGVRLVAGGFSLFVTNDGRTRLSHALVYTSTDSGATWRPSFSTALVSDNYETIYMRGVASSANGDRLLAIELVGDSYTGSLFTSSDSGLTWVTNAMSDSAPIPSFNSVACSADARTLVLCRLNDLPGVFISTDWGSSWRRAITDRIWSVTCSADGSRLAALDDYGLIHSSADAGATWTRNSLPYHKEMGWLASSADGSTLIAAVSGGGIYVSQEVRAPLLETRITEAKLVLSWIVPSQPFVLQQNSNLTTENWVDLATDPTLNHSNLHYEICVPLATTGRMFYRLMLAGAH